MSNDLDRNQWNRRKFIGVTWRITQLNHPGTKGGNKR